MKTKNILFLVSLLVSLVALTTACSETGDDRLGHSAANFGLRSPVNEVPELKGDYRPTGLSKKLITNGAITYAPMDFKNQMLSMTFDAAAKTIEAHSNVIFAQNFSGRPYFEILVPVTSIKLNGELVETTRISDPDGLNLFYIALGKQIESGTTNVMEVEYEIPATSVNFENGGIGFFTGMGDLETARYFEHWGPTSFEDDQWALTLHLQILNSSSPHQLFANGRTTQLGMHEWVVDFPSHYTTSSFYAHLTNRQLVVNRYAVATKNGSVPVVIYADAARLVEQAVAALPALFSELENDYGPYPHDSFIAYIQNGGGGMEYVGGTITSLGALGHELFHSWFARGVMPAEGRSGWIDEAMASWRDNGYFKADSVLKRPPTTLAAYSPFRKSTPDNSYADGRKLLAELDIFLAYFGGMKPLIRDFHARYRYRVVTTEELIAFLNAKTDRDVKPFFQRYAFGVDNSAEQSVLNFASSEVGTWNDSVSLHPPALTEADLKRLR